MSILKRTGLIAVTALVLTLVGSWNFSGQIVGFAGIGIAHAAGPNDSNNPGKCKSATNPKCQPITPSV